jgi:uncharacterized protein (TIGR02271 family)
MPLVTLKDFYPDHQEGDSDGRAEIKQFDVYTQADEKVGSVTDILVDEQTGRFRYLVVDTGFWIFGKKVLLPVGLANINYTDQRVDVKGLTKSQIEDLPNFDDLEKVDYDYEEQLRSSYRPLTTASPAAAKPAAAKPTTAKSATAKPAYDRNTYDYDRDPALYNLNDHNQGLKLYEERLIANKQRRKTGEVAVGKHVETQTTHVSVPVDKERVVIERTAPQSGDIADPTTAFQEGEVARMEVYEETPDIHKEAFVREEVRVKKVVDHDTVNAEETVRREELDIDKEGRSGKDKKRR